MTSAIRDMTKFMAWYRKEEEKLKDELAKRSYAYITGRLNEESDDYEEEEGEEEEEQDDQATKRPRTTPNTPKKDDNITDEKKQVYYCLSKLEDLRLLKQGNSKKSPSYVFSHLPEVGKFFRQHNILQVNGPQRAYQLYENAKKQEAEYRALESTIEEFCGQFNVLLETYYMPKEFKNQTHGTFTRVMTAAAFLKEVDVSKYTKNESSDVYTSKDFPNYCIHIVN